MCLSWSKWWKSLGKTHSGILDLNTALGRSLVSYFYIFSQWLMLHSPAAPVVCLSGSYALSLLASLPPSGRRAPPRMLLPLLIWLPRYKSCVSLRRRSGLINYTTGERRRESPGMQMTGRSSILPSPSFFQNDVACRRLILPPEGSETGCNFNPSCLQENL